MRAKNEAEDILKMQQIQVEIIKLVQGVFSFAPTNILKYLNYLDSIWFYLVLLVFAYFFLRKEFKHIVALMLTSMFSNIFLKFVFSLSRPPKEVALIALESPTFPSGAAQGAMILFLVLRNYSDKYIWVAVPLVVIMCLSRIILGVHYPSDILGGLLVGSGIYYGYYKTDRKQWVVLVTFLLAIGVKSWQMF